MQRIQPLQNVVRVSPRTHRVHHRLYSLSGKVERQEIVDGLFAMRAVDPTRNDIAFFLLYLVGHSLDYFLSLGRRGNGCHGDGGGGDVGILVRGDSLSLLPVVSVGVAGRGEGPRCAGRGGSGVCMRERGGLSLWVIRRSHCCLYSLNSVQNCSVAGSLNRDTTRGASWGDRGRELYFEVVSEFAGV